MAIIENNEFMIGIFLNLSKAFDTVNHNILLQKLEFYGMRGLCYDWFRNYLADRQQSVKYNSTYSENKSITFSLIESLDQQGYKLSHLSINLNFTKTLLKIQVKKMRTLI